MIYFNWVGLRLINRSESCIITERLTAAAACVDRQRRQEEVHWSDYHTELYTQIFTQIGSRLEARNGLISI